MNVGLSTEYKSYLDTSKWSKSFTGFSAMDASEVDNAVNDI